MFYKSLAVLLLIVSMGVMADEKNTIKTSGLALTSQTQTATGKLTENDIKLKIAAHVPRIQVTSVTQSEIPGLYRVDTNAGIVYMTHDGTYFIEGDLYTFTDNGIKNLTDAELDKKRQAALAKLDPKEMIIFSPPKDKIKTTITVFTDIDCGYCRKLHAGMKQMNDLGIEVRYLAFPRAGLASESYNKFVSAWCASDKQEALTKEKAGESIPAKTCDNPVADQYKLGISLGITGTPGIIAVDGRLLPGYLPPEQLAKELGIAAAVPPIPMAR